MDLSHYHSFDTDSQDQKFIQEKIGSKNRPLTKIDDLKTDPSQKLEILKWTLHKN